MNTKTLAPDYWGEDPEFPVSDWRHEVAEDNTRSGYWEWVAAQREAKEQQS